MKKIDLVDTLFSTKFKFKSCILCTYSLNLNFFENYLMKLEALTACPNICIFTDSSTYDGFINEAPPPRWLNKKYLVNKLKTGGVFHPKLYIFASDKEVVFSIGSANLTRDGVASNLEIISTFIVSSQDLTYAPLLAECIDYLKLLSRITCSPSAINQIDDFAQLCKPYFNNEIKCDISFIHNINSPIIDSILKMAKTIKVSKIQIISPFYDSDLSPLKVLQQELPFCRFEIIIQQNKSNFPKAAFKKYRANTGLFLHSNIDRYMHGKAILLYSDHEILLFTGSANFTKHALNWQPGMGNYEIGIIGKITPLMAEDILCPTGKKPIKVMNLEEIESIPRDEFEPGKGSIEYIIESILNDDVVRIVINPDIALAEFKAKKFRLLDFNGNVYNQDVNKELSIQLTPEIKNVMAGKLAVQVLGTDNHGNTFESNITWVVELEGNSGDTWQRRFRRIYDDPSELISVLQEIMATGDENAIRLFLQMFDIPLDLIIPMHGPSKVKAIISKGNIEGGIPNHHNGFLSSGLKNAYGDCLSRLCNKLEHHKKTPQLDKFDNFVTIMASMFSLIHFIDNDLIFPKYGRVVTVDSNAWASIRDFYDLVFKYADKSWKLLWDENGYRFKLNLKKSRNGVNGKDSNDLKEIICCDYLETFNDFTAIVLHAINNFEFLKKTLIVKIKPGVTVKPEIFSGNHFNLQPRSLQAIKALFSLPLAKQ